MTADLELQGLGETDALLKTSERPKKRALAIQIVALCGAAALAGAALASRAGPRDVKGSFSDQAGRVYSICISACVGLPGVGAGPARGIWGLATAPSPLGAAFG